MWYKLDLSQEQMLGRTIDEQKPDKTSDQNILLTSNNDDSVDLPTPPIPVPFSKNVPLLFLTLTVTHNIQLKKTRTATKMFYHKKTYWKIP